MNKRWKWIVSLGTVFLVVFFSGYHFLKPYYRFRFSPVEVTKVNAMTTIRKVVPGGPARYLSQDGDYIVGIGQISVLNTDWAVYLYDTNGTLSNLNDDTYSIIDSAAQGSLSNSIVEGDYVTWTESIDNNCAFVLSGYKISTQALFTIESEIINNWYSRDNAKVVYSVDGISGSDIKIYDLSTNAGSMICSAANDQNFPVIKGNYIAWADFRNKETLITDIYKYNLTTNQESIVANSPDYEYNPFINENSIIYSRKTANTNDLRIYNLTTSADTVISSANLPDQIGTLDCNSAYVTYTKSNWPYKSLELYSIENSSNSTIYSSAENDISTAILGNTQVAYHISSPFDLFGSVMGYDIPNSSSYTIRDVGDTYWEISINRNSDYLMITSEGSGNDPDEWDISLVMLP